MTTALAALILHLVGLGPALAQVQEWGVPADVGPAVVWAAARTPGSMERNLPLVASMGYVESRWTAKPRRHGTGCGWSQILPVAAWGRPTCDALEASPVLAGEWAGRIMGECLLRHHGRVTDGLRCYNASDGREKYVRDVMRALARLTGGRVS